MNVSLLKILLCVPVCFQQKMTEVVTFQQFRTKKKASLPSVKKKFHFGNSKILRSITLIYLRWNIFSPGRKPTTFFLRNCWKSRPTFGKKNGYIWPFFGKKKGRCSKQNLNVSLLKIHLCLQVRFHQKMTKMVTLEQFLTKKMVGLRSRKKMCTKKKI